MRAFRAQCLDGWNSFRSAIGRLAKSSAHCLRIHRCSDVGSIIVSIWLPGPEYPSRERHVRLIDEIINSDAFKRCSMQMHDVGEAKLRWKAICISAASRSS